MEKGQLLKFNNYCIHSVYEFIQFDIYNLRIAFLNLNNNTLKYFSI